MRKLSFHRRAIVLLELLVAAGAGATVILGVAYFLTSGTLLFAKNVSTNLSHNSLRGSLDKLVQAVDQASGSITLIDTAGNIVTTGSAAGIVFDQYRGGPYVISHPGGSGLSSSATTLTLGRSTDEKASPMVPTQGDVLFATDATARMRVQSAQTGNTTAGIHTFGLTLQSPIGQSISWDANTVKPARLVRRVAFVVVPNGARNELRYYNNAETITNFATATGYSLVTNDIGTSAGDTTPFSNEVISGRNFLSVILRVRAGQYANRLSIKEVNNFSTVERVSLVLAPKGA